MSEPYTPSLSHPVPARKSKVIADTATHTGEWNKARVIGAAQISAITCPLKQDASNLAGTALADGIEIEGPITSITLTSGKMELIER